MTLYRNSLQPLYKQLKNALKQNIQKGKYKPDKPLPGERQLIEIYGVSRMTVRQAISELVSEGVLIRRQGSGTFINPKTSERLFLNLYGLVEELRLSGYEISIELVESGTISPDTAIREELQLPETEDVFSYKRLIRTDGKPMLVTNSFVPMSLRSVFESINVNISRDVIYEHLENCGYTLSDAIQKMGAGLPTAQEAILLACEESCPVLILYRTTYIEGGYPIIYTRAVYHQNYSFSLDLKRSYN